MRCVRHYLCGAAAAALLWRGYLSFLRWGSSAESIPEWKNAGLHRMIIYSCKWQVECEDDGNDEGGEAGSASEQIRAVKEWQAEFSHRAGKPQGVR